MSEMNNQIHVEQAKQDALRLKAYIGRGNEMSYWHNNRHILLNLIINDNINNFLNWQVITDTMCVHNAEYIKKEFLELRFAPDFFQIAPAIKESEVGNPIPSPSYPQTSESLIHHAYHLHSFEKTAKKDVPSLSTILEFGGGYGGMCKLLKSLGFKGNYVIYDLPEFSILQKFYLRSLGYTVCDTLAEFRDVGGIFCTSSLSDLDKKYDLLLSTWAISETTFDFRKNILDNISFDNYLIAYQDDFFGVNNHDYFNPFMKRIPIHWETWKIDHLFGEQFYMMGWK